MGRDEWEEKERRGQVEAELVHTCMSLPANRLIRRNERRSQRKAGKEG